MEGGVSLWTVISKYTAGRMIWTITSARGIDFRVCTSVQSGYARITRERGQTMARKMWELNKSEPIDICPECGSDRILTIKSKYRKEGHKWRRKQCEACGARFSTLEVRVNDRDDS